MNDKKNLKLKRKLARALAVSLCTATGGTGAFLLPIAANADTAAAVSVKKTTVSPAGISDTQAASAENIKSSGTANVQPANAVTTQSAGQADPQAAVQATTQAQNNTLQGTITNLITGNFTAIFFEYLERGTMYGLGVLASNDQNEGMAKALSITKRLLGNPQATALANIQKQCTEILNQLNALQKSMDNNFKYVEDLLRQIQAGNAKTAYTNLAKDMDTYKTRYTLILQKYVDLVNSLDAYAASGDSASAQKDLKEKYEAINALYEAANGISSRTQQSFNFADDLNHILSAVSNYNSGAPFKDSKGYYPISDTSKWGAKDARDTYISTYHDMILTRDNMEHEVYSDMIPQLNKMADIVTTYLTCYQYYVSFAAQKIYATPYADLGISEIRSERDKQHYIDNMWSDYNDAYYRAMRALAQALSEYDDELSGAMRPYDVNTTVYFGNNRNDIRWGYDFDEHKTFYEPLYKKSNLSEMKTTGKNKKNKTSDKMSAYQFRPYGSAKTYTVRKTNKEQGDILAGDLEYKAGTMQQLINFHGLNNYGPTCDYVNLITDPTSPTHISLLNSGSDLSDLLNASGKGSVGLSLPSYLKEHGLTDIPSNADYLITGKTAWNVRSDYTDHSANNDADFYWINVSKTLSLSNSNTENLDCENDIDDNGGAKSKPVMVMYSGRPVVAFYLPTSKDADIYGYYKDDKEKKQFDTRVVPESGRTIILKIRPHDGKYIRSLQLLDRHAKNENKKDYVLDDLLGESATGDNGADQVSNPLASAEPDENGYYTFSVNVPYRDAEVALTLGEESDLAEAPAKYEVTLADNDSTGTTSGYDRDEGILSFDDCSGRTTMKTGKNAATGVTVMPYSSYLCTGLEFYSKDGKKLDAKSLNVTDVTSETGKYTPNEKSYTFRMPAQDITVKAVYRKGYQVNLTKDSAYMLKFAGTENEFIDSGWNMFSRTFPEESAVRLNAMSLNSFQYISDYSVISTTQSRNYTVSPKGYFSYDSDSGQYMQEVELLMPASDITVKALTASRDSTQKLARITSVSGSGTVRFENTGSAVLQAKPGDTVSLQVTPSAGKNATVSITSAEDKSTVTYTTDAATGLCRFVMPDSDANISCTFTAKEKVIADKIRIPKPTGLKLKNVKKQSVRVTAVKPKDRRITGYRISYRISGKKQKWTEKTVNTGNKNLNTQIRQLKKGKTYQIRVRAYRKQEKKMFFSSYTVIKTVKIKR